jgi:uncharacterized protein (TIGR03067 family)
MTKRWVRNLGGNVAFVFLVSLAFGTARADDQEKLQGAWKVVQAEVGNDKATKGQKKELEVLIEGNALTLIEGDTKETVHFALEPTGKAHTIDFYKTAERKEKIWHGIYELDGKDVKLCWGPAGQERPKEFGVKKGTEQRYYIIRKK